MCKKFSALRLLDKGAIVLITLIYTVFAGLQWCSIRESNRINQEALLSVQRAHVNFKTIESTGIRDAQGRITAWHFFPQWENSGTTPTKIMRQHSSAKWSKETLPHDFDFNDVGPNDNINTLLAPKAIVSTGPLIIRPEVIAGLKEGKLHLFFWGWAAYSDIFQNSKAHLTEFCYELTVSYGDVTTGEGIRFLYVLCPSHNCADEDCKDYAETEKRLRNAKGVKGS